MKVVLLWAGLVWGWAAGARAWTWRSYPEPGGACAVGPPTLLCDPDRLLSPDDRRLANDQLLALRQRTPCDCFDAELCGNGSVSSGYALGIAMVGSVEEEAPRRLGDPPLMRAFAQGLFHRWGLGRCGDGALVVVCPQCQEVLLLHGDMTKRRIPDRVRKAMGRQAKRLLTFTNTSLLLDYLLTNYRTFLISSNFTPSVDQLVLPFQDLSSGVITVMVLTSFLTVAWVICVAYLVLQFLQRRALRQAIRSRSHSHAVQGRRGTGEGGKATSTPASTIGTASGHRLTLFSPATPTAAANFAARAGPADGRLNGKLTTARFSLSSAETAQMTILQQPAPDETSILVSGVRVGKRREAGRAHAAKCPQAKEPKRRTTSIRNSFREALMKRRSWTLLKPSKSFSSGSDRPSSRSGDEESSLVITNRRMMDSLPNLPRPGGTREAHL